MSSPDPYSLSPAERLAAAERLWTAQSKDCELASQGQLTKDEAQFFAAKARYLETIGKSLDIYRAWVKGGSPEIPPGQTIAGLERQINTFILQLQTGGKPW